MIDSEYYVMRGARNLEYCLGVLSFLASSTLNYFAKKSSNILLV